MTSPEAPSPPITIRPATQADAATLVRFNVAMATETEGKTLDAAVVARGVAGLLARPDRGFYVVLEEGGAVAASLMITSEWSDWRDGDFWWIQSVYVRPESRRRGHYRRLYEHVREQARAAPGVCGLRLYVEQENRVARTTYEALGMHETPYRLYEAGWP